MNDSVECSPRAAGLFSFHDSQNMRRRRGRHSAAFIPATPRTACDTATERPAVWWPGGGACGIFASGSSSQWRRVWTARERCSPALQAPACEAAAHVPRIQSQHGTDVDKGEGPVFVISEEPGFRLSRQPLGTPATVAKLFRHTPEGIFEHGPHQRHRAALRVGAIRGAKELHRQDRSGEELRTGCSQGIATRWERRRREKGGRSGPTLSCVHSRPSCDQLRQTVPGVSET